MIRLLTPTTRRIALSTASAAALAVAIVGPVCAHAQGTTTSRPPVTKPATAPKPATPPKAAAPAKAAAPMSAAAQRKAILLDPTRSFWKAKAPSSFQAKFETSKGAFTLQLDRDWAPNGVDRFYNLARAGFFDDSRFYRVVPFFVAQFGLAGDPAVARAWIGHTIPADSVTHQNLRGTLTFAQLKPTSRATDLFINLLDHQPLDAQGFVPIGRVIDGMDVVDSLYNGYGEGPAMAAPIGNPKRLYGESNKYLDAEYPKLDRIIKVTIDTLAKPKPDSTRSR